MSDSKIQLFTAMGLVLGRGSGSATVEGPREGEAADEKNFEASRDREHRHPVLQTAICRTPLKSTRLPCSSSSST